LGIGISAFFADFKAETPHLTVSTHGRLLCMALQILYVTLGGLLGAGAWLLIRALGLSPFWCGLGAALGFAGATTAFVILSIFAGAKRLQRIEW